MCRQLAPQSGILQWSPKLFFWEVENPQWTATWVWTWGNGSSFKLLFTGYSHSHILIAATAPKNLTQSDASSGGALAAAAFEEPSGPHQQPLSVVVVAAVVVVGTNKDCGPQNKLPEPSVCLYP
jgi:hypothetical protein